MTAIGTLFRLLVIVAICIIALMTAVNTFAPVATHSHQTDQCTRYCHDVGCSHFDQTSSVTSLKTLYAANIHWLRNNPLGISYQQMNLLVYVIGFPTLWAILLLGIIKRFR